MNGRIIVSRLEIDIIVRNVLGDFNRYYFPQNRKSGRA